MTNSELLFHGRYLYTQRQKKRENLLLLGLFHVEVGLAFRTPKFYIAPDDKISHRLVNLSSNCDVKSGLRLIRHKIC